MILEVITGFHTAENEFRKILIRAVERTPLVARVADRQRDLGARRTETFCAVASRNREFAGAADNLSTFFRILS